jgi:hypothetical protein
MPSLSPKDRISLCLFSFSDGRPSRRPHPPTSLNSHDSYSTTCSPLRGGRLLPSTPPQRLHQLLWNQHLHPPKKYLIHAQAH